MGVLRLQMATDPRWVNIVEMNPQEILTDHAWCEQKAASSAISIIVGFPEYTEVVNEMTALVREEMEHFQRVHDFIQKRGYTLGRERKDPYVNDLLKFVKKGVDRPTLLVEKLLVGAMIEARSCERFRLLSEHINDPELSVFYRELMESEAGHYTMFITLARSIKPREYVDKRWFEFLEYEASVMENYGKGETIHG
ncbi:MAG: tRNA-(ms[2]io[6]A)-hydroxylase [Flavobacteriales bacterium]|nr:tRNA-(ms[2]io[6]A)-hydroxylase [Flavobacteriales bacterium]